MAPESRRNSVIIILTVELQSEQCCMGQTISNESVAKGTVPRFPVGCITRRVLR